MDPQLVWGGPGWKRELGPQLEQGPEDSTATPARGPVSSACCCCYYYYCYNTAAANDTST